MPAQSLCAKLHTSWNQYETLFQMLRNSIISNQLFFLFPPLFLSRFINLCEQHSCSKDNHMNSNQTISKNFCLQGQRNNTGIPNVVLRPCGDLTRWLMHFLSTSPLIFNTNDKSHKFYFSWKYIFPTNVKLLKTSENFWKLLYTSVNTCKAAVTCRKNL